MPYVKVTGWPVVLADDDGICPAGDPDECFYCRRKVGSPHAPDCVTVSQLVRLAVYCERAGGPERVGTYDQYVPHAWGADNVEHSYNDGTWCADNALGGIVWAPGIDPAEFPARTETGPCLCATLVFRLAAVLDPGPLVVLPEPSLWRSTE